MEADVESRHLHAWVPAVVPVEPSQFHADPEFRALEREATEAAARFYSRYADLFNRPSPELRRQPPTPYELRRVSREMDAARSERDAAEARLIGRRDELIAALEARATNGEEKR